MTIQFDNIDLGEKQEIQGKSLEDLSFSSGEEKAFLKEWLSLNTSMTIEFITRGQFQEKKGDFLEEIQKGNQSIPSLYKISLPIDIKIFELPSIILKINKNTFGEDQVHSYSSSEEIKKYIGGTIFHLLLLKSSGKKEKDIKRAIKKYMKLFETYFPDEDFGNFSQKSYWESIGGDKRNQFSEFNAQLKGLKGDLSDIESILSQKIEGQFKESIFEKGDKNFTDFMRIFTYDDFKKLPKNLQEKEGKRVDKYSNKSEIKIREVLNIDQYKIKLTEARKSDDIWDVVMIEHEILRKLIKEVYKFPWNDTVSTIDASSPRSILGTKKMQCVGKSILAHSFLQELGIKHYAIDSPSHSALTVLDSRGQEYYYDPTNYQAFFNFSDYKSEKRGEYLFYSKLGYGNGVLLKRGDPEKILQSHILFNKGTELQIQGNNTQAIFYYKKALDFNKTNSDIYFNLGMMKLKEKKYTEAIDFFQQGLILNPLDFNLQDRLKEAKYKKILHSIKNK